MYKCVCVCVRFFFFFGGGVSGICGRGVGCCVCGVYVVRVCSVVTYAVVMLNL